MICPKIIFSLTICIFFLKLSTIGVAANVSIGVAANVRHAMGIASTVPV